MKFIHSVGRYETEEKACEIAEKWESEPCVEEARILKKRKWFYVLVKVDIGKIKTEDDSPFKDDPFR